MSITPNKKEFICYISGGLSALMNSSMLAGEIFTKVSSGKLPDDVKAIKAELNALAARQAALLKKLEKAGQDDDNEVYIYDNFLEGSTFYEDSFCGVMEHIDDQTLKELLKYFDDRDINISRAYIESCLVPSDLPKELRGFAESIDYKEICTFEDFLEL